MRAPDGICDDARGNIWVANALAQECVLVAQGGEILDTVTTSQNCYACALGGEGGRDLFMMTAVSSDHEAAAASPKGRIERVRLAQ
jgi:sugar lactone lactonase YvrE